MHLLKTLLTRFVRVGTLELVDVEGKTHVFSGGPGPKVSIRLKDRKLYRSLFLNPELYAGEAYMDGTLVMEGTTIRQFLEFAEINGNNLRKHPLQRILHKGLKGIRKLHQRHLRTAQRQRVAVMIRIARERIEPEALQRAVEALVAHERQRAHRGHVE